MRSIRRVISELGEAFRMAREDASVKALILTGAGEKAFVAGADIGELAKVDAIEAERISRRGQEIFRALETLRKPSVAAINGFALGGGLELAMCCTIRIASPNAKLGQPEVKLGIVARLWRHAAFAAVDRSRPGARIAALGRFDRRGGSASHRACQRHRAAERIDRDRETMGWKSDLRTARWLLH